MNDEDIKMLKSLQIIIDHEDPKSKKKKPTQKQIFEKPKSYKNTFSTSYKNKNKK